jgi:hypothetical protein
VHKYKGPTSRKSYHYFDGVDVGSTPEENTAFVIWRSWDITPSVKNNLTKKQIINVIVSNPVVNYLKFFNTVRKVIGKTHDERKRAAKRIYSKKSEVLFEIFLKKNFIEQVGDDLYSFAKRNEKDAQYCYTFNRSMKRDSTSYALYAAWAAALVDFDKETDQKGNPALSFEKKKVESTIKKTSVWSDVFFKKQRLDVSVVFEQQHGLLRRIKGKKYTIKKISRPYQNKIKYYQAYSKKKSAELREYVLSLKKRREEEALKPVVKRLSGLALQLPYIKVKKAYEKAEKELFFSGNLCKVPWYLTKDKYCGAKKKKIG